MWGDIIDTLVGESLVLGRMLSTIRCTISNIEDMLNCGYANLLKHIIKVCLIIVCI